MATFPRSPRRKSLRRRSSCEIRGNFAAVRAVLGIHCLACKGGSMAVEMQCGGCGKRYRVGDQLAGKKVKCKSCGHVMAVPAEEFLQDSGPVALRNPGDSGAGSSARKKPTRAAVAAEEDSFEAIAAMAAMDDDAAAASSRR